MLRHIPWPFEAFAEPGWEVEYGSEVKLRPLDRSCLLLLTALAGDVPVEVGDLVHISGAEERYGPPVCTVVAGHACVHRTATAGSRTAIRGYWLGHDEVVVIATYATAAPLTDEDHARALGVLSSLRWPERPS